MAAALSVSITKASRLFIDSYARAVELLSHKSVEPSDRSFMARAMTAHFGPTAIFQLGQPPFSVQTSAEMTPVMDQLLARFEKFGIGYNISLEKSRVEVLSKDNAACFVTWRTRPATTTKVEAWSFEILYMYRRGGTFDPRDEQHKVGFTGKEWTVPEGRWEAIFMDNETSELVARFPDFMDQV